MHNSNLDWKMWDKNILLNTVHQYFILVLVFIAYNLASAQSSGDSVCTPNLCENGGTCSEQNPGSCVCASGFEGTHCESDIDECSNNLHYCPAYSTCLNTPGSYTCTDVMSVSNTPSPGVPTVHTSHTCINPYNLMGNSAVVSDNDVVIKYQESRIPASDIFNGIAIRNVSSVARETLTVDFPQYPEFWVKSISIKSDQHIKVGVLLLTSQTCTDQNNGTSVEATRTFSRTDYVKANAEHYIDLSSMKNGEAMACLSRIILKAQLITTVIKPETFMVETNVFGCTLLTGDSLQSCLAHDLLGDFFMYGRIYVEWTPTSATVQTLRPGGPGLFVYYLMDPSVKVNVQMEVQSVTLIGNVYSTNVTTDVGSTIGLRENDPTRLTVAFDPSVTTSTIIVTPGLPDNMDNEFIFTLEIMGCLQPANKTTATTDRNTVSTSSTTMAPTLPSTSATTSAVSESRMSSSKTIPTSSALEPVTEAETTSSASASTSQTATKTILTTVKRTTVSTVSSTTKSTTQADVTGSCCMITCNGNGQLSQVELEEKLKLLKNLTIPQHHTSKARRRKISAPDRRPLAAAVGSCCGIVVFTLTGVFIVVMDVEHGINAYYFVRSLFT